jgi:uncharacterized secreted protein with C-terminal beta-propeller domain
MRVARLTRTFLLLVGAAVLATSLLSTGAHSSPAPAPGPRLKHFAGCGEFLSYVRTHARRIVGPYGLGRAGPAVLAPAADRAAGAGVDYSTTNVQEAGIDEPDIVKTDGDKIVALAGGKLRVVSLGGGKPQLAGSLPLEEAPRAILLYRDRVLVISHTPMARPLPGANRSSIVPFPSRTVLTEVDVSTPSRPRMTGSLSLDGSYLDARLVGSAARLVITSTPPIELEPPSEPGPDRERAAEARNRAVIDASRARSWLPSYVLENRRTGLKRTRLLMGCRQVARPQRFSGVGMLSVVTLDLSRGLVPADVDGLLSDGQTVYASKENLYVATQRWVDPAVFEKRPPTTATALHKFDISRPLETRYQASGAVPGYVQNQFSLSEDGGVLRVATTELPLWWGDARTESESLVTTFAERSGKLVPLGRVGGLGRGERTYGVRFIGDVGYVVTFRQVDPLYVIDLSRPTDPVVRGELKIRGYSAYLHPLGGDLLLGVGQDATEEGRVLGTQVSVFDVSNARRPTLLRRQRLDKAWSEAEWDHHAFLYWPPARLAVLPVQASIISPGPDRPFSGAVVVRVGRSSIELVGTVSHADSAPVRRSLVVGTMLYTLSDSGVEASILATLAQRAWIPFP